MENDSLNAHGLDAPFEMASRFSAPESLTDHGGAHNPSNLFKLLILLCLFCINNIRDLFKKNNYCHIFRVGLSLEIGLVFFFKKEVTKYSLA
jgi:hypothetical protein